jgi:hypothetical protein
MLFHEKSQEKILPSFPNRTGEKEEDGLYSEKVVLNSAVQD